MRRIFGTLLMLAGTAVAQQPSATVRGSVLDPEKLPIANARVTLTSLDAPSSKFTATTDALGLFTVENLEPGSYSVEIRATGFHVYQESSIPLRPDENATLPPRRLSIDLKQAVCILTVTSEPNSKGKQKRGNRK